MYHHVPPLERWTTEPKHLGVSILQPTPSHLTPRAPGVVLLQEGAARVQQGRGDFGWSGGPRQATGPGAADGQRSQAVTGLPQGHWPLSAWPHWSQGLM